MRRKSIQTKSYTYVQTVQAFDWYFDEFELDDQRSLQDKIEFLQSSKQSIMTAFKLPEDPIKLLNRVFDNLVKLLSSTN